jgi:tRNA threonylcarbamoyladenosine biosynthesis protein TsaB
MSGVLVLALDTSGDIAVSLVASTGDVPPAVLAARRSSAQRRHAELLAPMITEVLGDARVRPDELGAVVTGTGPAPFTGLRACLVTARVLAFALGIEVRGVCSLDALAAQAFAAGLSGDVLVVTDARRREVYAARYRRAPGGEVELLAGPEVQLPAVTGATIGNAAVVGAGTALYPDLLPAAPGAPLAVDPAVLASLALAREGRGVALPTEPLYLRRPDVTPALAVKRVTG